MKIAITAEPQVGMGGVVVKHSWNLVTEDRWLGHVAYHPKGKYGDGKFWLDAPGMRRRGYASLESAMGAVARKKLSEES